MAEPTISQILAKKKKPNRVDIAVIMDRSYSMNDNEKAKESLGGFNVFLKEQREAPGNARLTLVLFDDQYEIIHDSVELNEVEDLTDAVYYPRGNTALLDAFGKTIITLEGNLKDRDEADRPDRVIVVLMTDGQENCSKEYNLASIKELVSRLEKEGWTFIYMGADPNTMNDAYSIGVTKASLMANTGSGHFAAYRGMSAGISVYRSGQSEDVEIAAEYSGDND